MPKYNFKAAEEILWLILSAILPILLDAMIHFDSMNLNNAWLLVLLTACVRAVGGALLTFWAKRAGQPSAVTVATLDASVEDRHNADYALTGVSTVDNDTWGKVQDHLNKGAELILITSVGKLGAT